MKCIPVFLFAFNLPLIAQTIEPDQSAADVNAYI